MKKICKVFLSVILVALCVCTIIPFAGCGGGDDTPELPNATKNGEWIEVYSITYNIDGSSKTLKSNYEIESEREEVTESEYNNASNEQKTSPFTGIDFKVNRKEFVSTIKKYVGRYLYYPNNDFTQTHYYKETIKNYKLYYVRVRFLDNDCLEINYNDYNENQYWTPKSYNTTIRILPISYMITYFND